MERVSVVIVNWNTGKLLSQCLASLEALPERSMIQHVVIVDNASTDTSIVQAKPIIDRSRFILLLQHENIGFAAANNIGISYIQNHTGEQNHILLLNPDTIVHPHAVEHMIIALVSDITIAVVGPRILEITGEIQPSVRKFPTRTVFFLYFLKLHLFFRYTSIWRNYMMSECDYTRQQTVDQVMGAALLMRNTVLKNSGLLDEGFWIWFEEVDYCKRVQDAGLRVLYTPAAEITHIGAASFHQLVGIRKTKPFLDSALYYIRKHMGIFSYLFFLALYPLAIVIALVASIAHMQQKDNNKSRL